MLSILNCGNFMFFNINYALCVGKKCNFVTGCKNQTYYYYVY